MKLVNFWLKPKMNKRNKVRRRVAFPAGSDLIPSRTQKSKQPGPMIVKFLLRKSR